MSRFSSESNSAACVGAAPLHGKDLYRWRWRGSRLCYNSCPDISCQRVPVSSPAISRRPFLLPLAEKVAGSSLKTAGDFSTLPGKQRSSALVTACRKSGAPWRSSLRKSLSLTLRNFTPLRRKDLPSGCWRWLRQISAPAAAFISLLAARKPPKLR